MSTPLPDPLSLNPDLSGRVALVTGASRGIGYFTALALAKAGAHVIAIARTQGGLEELDDEIKAFGGTATIQPVDLNKGELIDQIGQAVFARWGKLDIVIGNAGILGPLSPLGHIKPKQWEEAMRLNLNANWRLIASVDPLLRQSDCPRALFMTSSATYEPRSYWGPYAVSKMALEQLVLTYAQEVRNTPIKVNLINPGPLRTAMRAKVAPGEDPETVAHPSELAPAVLGLCADECAAHGLIYDFPKRSFMSRSAPAPVTVLETE